MTKTSMRILVMALVVFGSAWAEGQDEKDSDTRPNNLLAFVADQFQQLKGKADSWSSSDDAFSVLKETFGHACVASDALISYVTLYTDVDAWQYGDGDTPETRISGLRAYGIDEESIELSHLMWRLALDGNHAILSLHENRGAVLYSLIEFKEVSCSFAASLSEKASTELSVGIIVDWLTLPALKLFVGGIARNGGLLVSGGYDFIRNAIELCKEI